ncbi:hypothetical protein EIN_135050 [Entamoeba invadens IP1]|uniref:Uncharacterized protein n=1 Tax=Entamoeba invadens IP1 TaxID=370355 RepID=A0A0A1U0A6_ENTIV|nr:hypothetical protein EIN_135050 [Entamoeba invadens IP1]ELP85921.1 hypothetical protein EIN_135050 [Entamoeba invadens IP1]|eukprot:XP_004185267.1 hypothetical protein EIN_135050 [Entamoeba invadens IP1]
MSVLMSAQKESKSYEAIQQGILISLLVANGVSIELNCPSRFASKTMQLFVIRDVYINNISIDFGRRVEEECQKQYELDSREMGVKSIGKSQDKLVKNLKRRRDLNKAALSFNSIFNLVQNYGYTFDLKQVKGSKKTLQMIKIKNINFNGMVWMNEDEIIRRGTLVNQYITSLCRRGTSSLTFEGYDPQLYQILTSQENKQDNYSQETLSGSVMTQERPKLFLKLVL